MPEPSGRPPGWALPLAPPQVAAGRRDRRPSWRCRRGGGRARDARAAHRDSSRDPVDLPPGSAPHRFHGGQGAGVSARDPARLRTRHASPALAALRRRPQISTAALLGLLWPWTLLLRTRFRVRDMEVRVWMIFVRDRLSGSWGSVASPTATVPRPATLAMDPTSALRPR